MHTSRETREYLEIVPDKFEFVFTPKHTSWINIIESFFQQNDKKLIERNKLNQ
ncbi:transposase [Methanosarcina spelaei]|uniref:transposase n=1 Tax=Methanosarcina spelaei TaxID=1036679 RepID=UPI000BAB7540